jgi:hypothetical protein
VTLNDMSCLSLDSQLLKKEMLCMALGKSRKAVMEPEEEEINSKSYGAAQNSVLGGIWA